MIKEVTVFSYGDSKSLKTWSNVPYFFTTTIEQKGIRVNRVNMKPNRYLNGFWNKVILKLIQLGFKDTTYTFERTMFYRWYTHFKMKKAVQKYPNTDAFISISFSYHPKKYTDKPVLMFCDWTYQYYFKYFEKRNPDILEQQEINNQHMLQKNVDKMIVLFPDVARYIEANEYTHNVYYLGNVVNSFPISMNNVEINKKLANQHLVFIGTKKYMEGLVAIVATFKKLKLAFPNVKLDIIGMTAKEFKDTVPIDVKFHGYLDKSDAIQNHKYYEIVNNATLFVNTTPGWSAFSGSLDVMYHFTPVLISKYKSFEETFGEQLDFGYYCENTVDALYTSISAVFNMDKGSYENLAINAREKVTPFSWEVYIGKVLGLIG